MCLVLDGLPCTALLLVNQSTAAGLYVMLVKKKKKGRRNTTEQHRNAHPLVGKTTLLYVFYLCTVFIGLPGV